MKTFLHDPQSSLDYQFDFSAELGVATIASSSVSVPSGLTQVGAVDEADQTVTVYLTGGTIGMVYQVTCNITDSDGRVYDLTYQLKVESN